MQIWVWQTGEGTAVRLLEDRFQLGAWTWLVSSCTLSDASNWCPQTTLVLCGPSNSAAWMSAPMCMCDCWLWSAQQIVYSSKASFGAVDLLLPYWSLVLWYFILFSFSFKEILKHGILNTAENFVNNTRMDGGFRKKINLKKRKKEKKKTFYREQKKRLPVIVFLLCIKATDLFWQPKYDPVVDSIPIWHSV